MTTLTILIPTYNEEQALPETLAALARLAPQPDEILLVDGKSEDRTVELATAGGIRITIAPRKGKGAQINHGVEMASGELVCVLHADSTLPDDAVTVMRSTMADDRTALASFTPRFIGQRGTRWGSTINNWLKTWYLPLIARPHLFLCGFRLLYGDHAMFFRRTQFIEVGGCDPHASVMEEADMCIRLAQLGRVRMVPRWVWTSDRRIAAWGRWRANWVYFKMTVLWALGLRHRAAGHYPDIR